MSPLKRIRDTLIEYSREKFPVKDVTVIYNALKTFQGKDRVTLASTMLANAIQDVGGLYSSVDIRQRDI